MPMSATDAATLISELVVACGGDESAVKADPETIREVSLDKSFHAPSAPICAAAPSTPDEVAACVKVCIGRGVPIVPRGAGTGVEGGCIPYSGGVVMSTERLQTISLNREDGVCSVGAGVRKVQLNKYLHQHGLLFGPDPSSNPAIGGMASTAGSGMSTIRYGTTRENVVSMLVCTPQGHLLRTRKVVRKSSTGYDMNNLYMGSEGTLGIICELTVKVWPLPLVRSGGTLEFETVKQACDCVVELVRSKPPGLLKCEMLNAEGVKCTNAVFHTNLSAKPTLFLELIGFTSSAAGELKQEWDSIIALATRFGVGPCRFASDGEELDSLWDARRGCYLAAAMYRRKKGGDLVLLTDVCVPLSQLAECVTITERIFEEGGFPCVMCCHIADGNFHCCVPYQPEEKAACVALEEKVLKQALAMGGTASGEHGIGVGKIKHVRDEHGDVHLCCQHAIKSALDPLNLMNPGKMLPPLESLDKSVFIPGQARSRM